MKKRTSVSIALAAVLLTIFAGWYAHRPVAEKPYSWNDAQLEAQAGGYRLITTEALDEKYRDMTSSLLLVDTRQEWEYRTGHIAGAVNFPIEATAWSRRHKTNALQQLLGPDKERLLVFY